MLGAGFFHNVDILEILLDGVIGLHGGVGINVANAAMVVSVNFEPVMNTAQDYIGSEDISDSAVNKKSTNFFCRAPTAGDQVRITGQASVYSSTANLRILKKTSLTSPKKGNIRLMLPIFRQFEVQRAAGQVCRPGLFLESRTAIIYISTVTVVTYVPVPPLWKEQGHFGCDKGLQGL